MFNGYSPETVDFLWGIRLNNNREWFLEHKPDYVNYLYQPTKALGQYLFQPFLDKPGNLLKVSRIYRDARMHHPVPYKESLWVCIRKDVEWWAEHPCLYFEITPEGISYGLLLWRPSPAYMERLRRRITEDKGQFLALLEAAERATGVSVTAECYKRPKPTEDADLARFFGWKGKILCVKEREFAPDTFGPALADQVRDFLIPLIPLYEYLCSI